MQNTRIFQTPIFTISDQNLRSNHVYHLNDLQRTEISQVLYDLSQWLLDPMIKKLDLFKPIQKSNKWKLSAWDRPVKSSHGLDYTPDSNIINDLIEYLSPISINGYGDDMKSHQVNKLHTAFQKIQVCIKLILGQCKKEWPSLFDSMNASRLEEVYQAVTFLRTGLDLSRPFEFVRTSSPDNRATRERMEEKRIAVYQVGNQAALEYYCKQINQSSQDWINQYNTAQAYKKRIVKKTVTPTTPKSRLEDFFTSDTL